VIVLIDLVAGTQSNSDSFVGDVAQNQTLSFNGETARPTGL